MSTARPIVALVGRPNVGKSTLFNRLIGKRLAIVHDMPGVTRDRHYAPAEIDGRPVDIVDTGGYDPGTDDDIMKLVRVQAQLALEEADVVAFVVDGRTGPMPADHEIAAVLRRAGKRVVVVVNKLDVIGDDHAMHEFRRLGLDPVVGISAEHAVGFDELADALTETLPPAPPLPELDASAAEGFKLAEEQALRDAEAAAEGDEVPDRPLRTPPERPRVAVVGRPNVGKSSLLNRLLGESRFLASGIPGTTRDAVDALLKTPEGELVLVDTAGIRRKARISQQVERYSVLASVRTMAEADVAVIMLDATELVTDQDQEITELALGRGCALVLCVNKWDLADNDKRKDVEEEVRGKLRFADFAPLVFLSAQTGKGVHKLLPTVREVLLAAYQRVGTGELNRFLAKTVDRYSPPMRQGKTTKLFYMAQTGVAPPRFVLATNAQRGVSVSYQRYLVNALRETYGFPGSKIVLRFRARTR